MTLTEQWKKGELKKNKYWVKYKNGKIDTWELSEGITIESKPEIIEVLAPVPSYEEWQETLRALDAARKAIKMEDETINRLVSSGKQCNYKNAQLKEENAKLKELLKRVVNATDFRHEIKIASVIDYRVWYNISSEIKQVLGEK